MTHDERIEAMARAIWSKSEHAFRYEQQKEYWDAIARAALAAAGVEEMESELAEARRERDEFRSALLAIFAVAEQYDTPDWNVVSDCAWLATAAIDAARAGGGHGDA
jgi:hypothetical protein